MASTTATEALEATTENPYITSLVKNMRAINKKLSAMHKTDAVIEANPNVSLDELVAQRKINQDQRASALKKPQLQAQLSALEEQVQQYKKFDAEYQAQLQKQKEELTTLHGADVQRIKQEAQAQAVAHSDAELKKKLLVLSQFLRAAAARRNVEEDPETDENRAFEGTLLLVYGGDQKAVDTAISLIEGTEEQVTSIEGTLLPVNFSQVKKASVDHAPFPTEDAYAEPATEADPSAGSDPTATHAGLTELQQPQSNGIPNASETGASTVQAEGNVAAERWDTTTGAEKDHLAESYEIIPRPNEEVDVPAAAPTEATQQPITSWADEPATGNLAGESWDIKAAGQEAGSDSVAQANGSTDDGFHEVAGRTRGTRGGPRGGRGDGNRGGRGRGRGGPHRGGRGDGEGRPRGGGGRARGPRGDGVPARS